MIRRILMTCLVATLAVAHPAQAALKVLATTSDWAALTTELGGDKVNVYAATNALQDVHKVDAKPSLVARARTADLVVANGAQLEVGWYAGSERFEKEGEFIRVTVDEVEFR